MRKIFPLINLFFVNMHSTAQSLTGNFEGTANGIAASASLQTTGSGLTGTIHINGRPGKVNATWQGSNCIGRLLDIEMQKNYSFTGSLQHDTLQFNVTFPELNNQVIELRMGRIKQVKIPVGAGLNNGLIGLWRHTETFSSGSGDNYASFSTDYFMDFRADGTLFSWTGKSGGSAGRQNIQGNSSLVEKTNWFTEGKTLFLVDQSKGTTVSLLFYAEPNRMMLHNGGQEKKILTRIK